MAQTVPTTNILFSDIYNTSNPAGSGGMLSLLTMSFFSFFAGPNGTGAQPHNNWGMGEAGGANRIYKTTAHNTNLKVSDFADLDYFYNGGMSYAPNYYNYDIGVEFENNAPPPIIPPDPPDVFDFNYSLTLYDNSYSIPYMVYGGLVNQGNSSYASVIRAPDDLPLINSYYWQVDIQTTPGYPGVQGNRNVAVEINGINYLTVTINNGTNTFLGSTYGTSSITGITSATDPHSTITPYTGSYWRVKIS